MTATSSDSVLIIAFDGLDYDLIQEYNLDKIPQKQFGKIDNNTGIHTRNTAELFASFLTGETHEKHGVKGLYRWDNKNIDRLETFLEDKPFFPKFYGIRCSMYKHLGFINKGRKRWYAKEDIEIDTIFDEVNDSKSIYVPSWDRNGVLEIGYKVFSDAGIDEGRRLARMEFEKRKEEVFEELSENRRDLLMCHFKYPDTIQDTSLDNDFKEMYQEIDELAGEILDAASQYDTIIFLSDHGLPLEGEHNKNAFFSSNQVLFNSGKPHITDFKSGIVEKTS